MLQDKENQKLYKIILAREAIDRALESLCWGIQYSIKENDSIFYSINTTVVISYGRAFSKNKPVGFISQKFIEPLDPKAREIHEDLIRIRNKMIAHSEHFKGRVSIERNIESSAKIVFSYHFIPSSEWPRLRDHLIDISAKIQKEQQRLVKAIFGEEDNIKDLPDLLGD